MPKKKSSKKVKENDSDTIEITSENLTEEDTSSEVEKSKLYQVLEKHLDNFDSLNQEDDENNIVPQEDRYSFPRMTKYEAVRAKWYI